MKVCIAEKPSVAREIAQIVGAKSRKDGFFEGNGYAVTWTFGHFCTLKTPDDYQPHWKKWDLNGLPILPEKFETKLIGNSGVKKQFKVIKQLFKQANVVINCGDAGQEGELIQRWVMNQAKYKGKVLRLWISSLTAEAIRDGFQNLQNASNYDNLYYAGSSRAIGDWLLGMNATRLYTLKYGGYKQVLSIGRVQTPTLAMIVARHLEIINFVSHPFWELQTIYRDIAFKCEKGRFLKKEDGSTILEQVEGKPFTITSSIRKNGKEYAPKLFDLTALQVFCNKRFSYPADKTLALVQKLYEQKIVTYPRVDTAYLPNDIYPKIPGILSKMTNYAQFTQPLLGTKLKKSKSVFDDAKVTDHHAIIPTGYQKSLLMDEQNVYDAIARRFIAVFYPDCLVANTTVLGEVDEIKFKTTGKEILDLGWRVLFPPSPKKSNNSQNKKDDEEKILPAFVKGESGPHLPSLIEKKTQPPKYYTEATLLRAMETAGKKVDDEELRDLMKANGIGRPSTRANIIVTLFKRKYIYRQKKSLIPTEIGVQLIDTIQDDLLKSAELTGQWEKKLREIEAGEHSAKQFVNDMKQMLVKLTGQVKQESGKPRIRSHVDKSTERKPASRKQSARKSPASKAKATAIHELLCPKCRLGKLLKGKAAFGCTQWKEGCTFRLPFKFMDKKIPDTQIKRLVAKGGTIKLKGFKNEAGKVDGKLIFNRKYELEFQGIEESTKAAPKSNGKKSEKKDQMKCPKCKEGIVVKGKSAYGCSKWKSGCTFRFTFEDLRSKANGEKLTKQLVIQILKG